MRRRLDPVAAAPIVVSLACAAVELLVIDHMARGEWDAALVVAACAAWAGLVLSALAGLALREAP